MAQSDKKSQFEAKLLHPIEAGSDNSWAFVVLPKEVSAKLPRRGRTTVKGAINGHSFQAMLEPDGKLSHWLRVDEELLATAGLNAGDIIKNCACGARA